MVGTIGTTEAGACITIHGCIQVGVIMILGTQDITVTVMVVGTIPGGVTAAITAVMAVITDIMAITTAMEADGAITAVPVHWDATLSPETSTPCPTANVISSPMSEADI